MYDSQKKNKGLFDLMLLRLYACIAAHSIPAQSCRLRILLADGISIFSAVAAEIPLLVPRAPGWCFISSFHLKLLYTIKRDDDDVESW